jgi:hypothetical protein
MPGKFGYKGKDLEKRKEALIYASKDILNIPEEIQKSASVLYC